MKRLLFALAVMMAVVTVPVIAADVGVSVQVGEPGCELSRETEQV